MWTSRKTPLLDGRAIKFAIDRDSTPVSYAQVIDHWQNNAEFRSFFTALLLGSPFSIFRWETPPVTRTTANQPFEFVLLDSPDLACVAEPSDFAEHFVDTARGKIVEFPNLGGDAILIVPCPENTSSDYGQLAAFLRNSPAPRQQALWRQVGAAMQRRLGSRPVWLSTAGGGVAWLHVRLDDRPKYYGYAAWRNAAG